MHILNHNFDRN